MKAVILAGGLGTRISEESILKPKPMIEIGGMPILWHIMKMYSAHNINDFIICAGYRGYQIKEYFANYFLHNSDISIDLRERSIDVHVQPSEPWKITIIDTGQDTQTGGRLKRVVDYLDSGENFCFTYGDGVSDVDISEVLQFHATHKRLATVVSVNPPHRFGTMKVEGDKVVEFAEKPKQQDGRINGGFFVLSTRCIEYIDDDETAWEAAPLQRLAQASELRTYFHDGFWQPMDTLRDKLLLESLWSGGAPPWKVWS
jgi:glucose-1-phosphate cytidylyltransferase